MLLACKHLIVYVCVCVQSFFPAMTKIVGTLGPKSRSVDTISGCLKAGMSGTTIYHIYCYLEVLCLQAMFSIQREQLICTF